MSNKFREILKLSGLINKKTTSAKLKNNEQLKWKKTPYALTKGSNCIYYFR